MELPIFDSDGECAAYFRNWSHLRVLKTQGKLQAFGAVSLDQLLWWAKLSNAKPAYAVNFKLKTKRRA